jgi:hypothetical protein
MAELLETTPNELATQLNQNTEAVYGLWSEGLS